MEAENFTCAQCGSNCSPRYFEISRNIERVHYKSPVTPDEVEVGDSRVIGFFCSEPCVENARKEGMARERVPITRPDINPIESCAVCRGPVYMRNWHVAYNEMEAEEEPLAIQPIWGEALAVVCQRCKPIDVSAEAVEANSDDRTYQLSIVRS